MIFSKSFGYALRGILYVSLTSHTKAVSLDDISSALGVPRFFMGKIMKRVVQRGILSSSTGPAGGFKVNENTLQTLLINVYNVTDHPEELTQCVLVRGECNSENPCRLHDLVLPIKTPLFKLLYHTTIGSMLQDDGHELLESLTYTYDSKTKDLPSAR